MADNLRELQLTELALFKVFDQICHEKNIPYYALGGTLLGAVRHQGFIPWDDDMDFGVPRPYYNELCDCLEALNEENLIFRTFHNDSTYIRYFGRLEDTRVEVVRADNLTEEVTHAWIDIFPLDAMPNNIILRKLWVLWILYLRAIYRFSCFDTLVNVKKKNRPWYEKVLIFIGQYTSIKKVFNTRKCLDNLEKALTRFDYNRCDFLVNAMGAYKFREMFHKKYYGTGHAYKFEDTYVWGPEDYDYICRQLYGDYMIVPDEDERNHHGIKSINKRALDNTKNLKNIISPLT